MQNKTTGRGMRNSMPSQDPFFKQTASSNFNTEAASMGTSSIDSKDLTVIEDEMHKEALLYKKCSTYANYFTDPSLKNMANKAAQHHRNHFDILHGYLNGTH